MATKTKSCWPETVSVVNPGDVGVNSYRRVSGKPCCAVGWAVSDGAIPSYHPSGSSSLRAKLFTNAYRRVAACVPLTAKIVAINSGLSVEGINDFARNKEVRALLLNATYAALGYTVGNDPKAVRLARKAGFEV